MKGFPKVAGSRMNRLPKAGQTTIKKSAKVATRSFQKSFHDCASGFW